MFGPKGPFCQSCGMPLNKDKGGGGTNADGTKSADYCSNCFQNGQFRQPDLNLDQMKGIVKERMKEMHIPGFMANYFMKDMGQLKRWKNN